MVFRRFAAACALVISTALPAGAEGRLVLGHGHLLSNDFLAGGQDRWQTGSVSYSRVTGSGWAGALPQRPFDILEYRIGGQVVAPDNLRRPAAGDRPYAGVLAFGLHTHFARGATEFALGGDLVFTGRQTGLSDAQTAFHDALGMKPASLSVIDNQVPNGAHPTLVFEAGQSIPLAGRGALRPFAEMRWGVETLARIGADLSLGHIGQGELLVRDPVTGQRYRSVTDPVSGMSLVLGGDFSWVQDSALLPAASGVTPSDTRTRMRAGVHWQGARNAAFYGVTWLSEEFTAQPEGQLVGSVRLKMQF